MDPDLYCSAFNCPHCDAYATHEWGPVVPEAQRWSPDYLYALCEHCGDLSFWRAEGNEPLREPSEFEVGVVDVPQGRMVYPESSRLAPKPNPDLADDLVRDYEEAASIVARSPRGAAALLRLVIQKLLESLGGRGSINNMIGALVKSTDTREHILQVLDVVRVVGNQSVHPGQLDMRDDVQTARSLFDYVNWIADELISRPRQAKEHLARLPQGARDGIDRRDKPKSN